MSFDANNSRKADKFGAIDGKLSATPKVNAVSLHSGHPDKQPAYTIVIAEFYSNKTKEQSATMN
ncbi:hypothetical protein ACWU4D_08495 [Vibrio sp. WJH972]